MEEFREVDDNRLRRKQPQAHTTTAFQQVLALKSLSSEAYR